MEVFGRCRISAVMPICLGFGALIPRGPGLNMLRNSSAFAPDKRLVKVVTHAFRKVDLSLREGGSQYTSIVDHGPLLSFMAGSIMGR